MKFQYACPYCKSTDIHTDAPVGWDALKEQWVLVGEPYDEWYCDDSVNKHCNGTSGFKAAVRINLGESA